MAKAKKSKAKKSKAKKSKAKKAPAKKLKKPARAAKAKVKAKKSKKPAKKIKKAAAKKPAPKKTVKKAPKKFVGEGDYAASRSFMKDEASFVKRNKAKIPAMGKAAEAALEGSEGPALLAAEAEAKNHSKAGDEA